MEEDKSTDTLNTVQLSDSSKANQKVSINEAKLSVLVLPPYDLIANAGISPDVQEYLEDEIAKDTNLVLIKFPYKKLMNVEIHNVYDKKYCGAVLEHVKADVLIMTKLDNVRLAGKMDEDKWNLSIRIYNANTGVQTDSEVVLENLPGGKFEETIAANQEKITAEIKSSAQK